MSLATDLNNIYQLTVRRRSRARTHAARMEDFYAPQAHGYDSFRERMLHGRRELFQQLPVPRDGVWIDLGGGTGRNVEYLGDQRASLAKLYIIDLSPSMLRQSHQRKHRLGWSNVEIIHADAATFRPPEELADVVTLSYALTMMPDWQAVLEHVTTLLKPGGLIGVVDFYISQPHPPAPRVRHSPLTRAFWPAWFGRGSVHLSPWHVPWLHARFLPIHFHESPSRLPYVPLARIPSYRFIGRNPGGEQRP